MNHPITPVRLRSEKRKQAQAFFQTTPWYLSFRQNSPEFGSRPMITIRFLGRFQASDQSCATRIEQVKSWRAFLQNTPYKRSFRQKTPQIGSLLVIAIQLGGHINRSIGYMRLGSRWEEEAAAVLRKGPFSYAVTLSSQRSWKKDSGLIKKEKKDRGSLPQFTAAGRPAAAGVASQQPMDAPVHCALQLPPASAAASTELPEQEPPPPAADRDPWLPATSTAGRGSTATR